MRTWLLRISLGLLALVVVTLLVEGALLLRLHNDIPRFAQYWQQNNAEATPQSSLMYVAFGDSTAQGIGASKLENSYVKLVADKVAAKTGKQVKIINLSVSGATTEDVLNQQLPAYQKLGIKPDLITIEIGANDIKNFNADQFQKSFKELVQQLPKGTYVSDIPWFGGRARGSSKAAQQASVIIRELVSKNGLTQVDLEQATHDHNGLKMYSADYFHPSTYGYSVWAEAFWQKIQHL